MYFIYLTIFQNLGGIVKNWKKRLFTCTKTKISYYEDETDNPKGEILVSDILSVDTTDDYLILVHTKTRTYKLKSENSEDMLSWYEAIRSALDI